MAFYPSYDPVAKPALHLGASRRGMRTHEAFSASRALLQRRIRTRSAAENLLRADPLLSFIPSRELTAPHPDDELIVSASALSRSRPLSRRRVAENVAP